MRGFLRTWWPVLTFGVGVIWFVSIDVADAIALDRARERSARDLTEYQAREAYRAMRAAEERREVAATVTRLLLMTFGPVFGIFLLVWAWFGVWSAITGEAVTW